ncbi:MAG: carboxylating nicotinate-nucleotide diphosphorylase [Actinomycetota bacterium]|nr:carboxylating nicotinate-nucleotide diphosphorylase [Actinomycetota bacterium]
MLGQSSLELVRLALAEDLSVAGDVTTDAVVPPGATGRGVVLAKQDAVLAGTDVFDAVFESVDADVKIMWSAHDGDDISPGQVIATIEGRLRSILTGERTALNFLQRLSGVATMTRRFVDAAPGIEVRDTRKTTPGMRALEKAAVRAAGGTNHRMGLFDAILLKDNHVAAAGGIADAVGSAAKTGLKVQVECETLDQVREALDAGANELLLDNMDIQMLKEAAALAGGRAKTEASGGITLATIKDVATSGVDAVSVGALTHSAPAVDLSLELEADDAARG